MAHNPAGPVSHAETYNQAGTQTSHFGLETNAIPSGLASSNPRDGFPLDRGALADALNHNHDHDKVQTQTQDITDYHEDQDDEEPLPDPMLEAAAMRVRHPDSIILSPGLPPDEESGGGDGPFLLPAKQGVPPELPNLAAEVIFVLICTAGQVISALTYGHVIVGQTALRTALGIPATQVPWLLGSALLASGLSVIVAGSLADLAPPKPLMVWAFAWSAAWHGVAAGAISPRLKVLFFMARAMQGLSLGVLVSASMSILGRVYKPGVRKTRVFSLMAAGAPIGFWIGCVHGGALSGQLPWLFGSTAIFLALVALGAQLTLPDLSPAKDSSDADVPSLRHFDYIGATLSCGGCGLLLFGLTQGASSQWSPYTYTLIVVGMLMFVAFAFAERQIARPLIPNGLWSTPGFTALLVAYFLGFGAYCKLIITLR